MHLRLLTSSEDGNVIVNGVCVNAGEDKDEDDDTLVDESSPGKFYQIVLKPNKIMFFVCGICMIELLFRHAPL